MLIVAFLAPAQVSAAGQWSTVFNGKAFHLGSEREWNEENYGLGVEYALESRSPWKVVYMANGFRDSDSNMSYMAGAGLHRTVFETSQFGEAYVDLGVNAFLMTRKDVDDGRPFPGALPSMTIGNRFVGMNIGYLPKQAVQRVTTREAMDKTMRGIVFVQLKVNVTNLIRATN